MKHKWYIFLTFLTAFFVVSGLFFALVSGATLQELMPPLLMLLAVSLAVCVRKGKGDSQ